MNPIRSTQQRSITTALVGLALLAAAACNAKNAPAEDQSVSAPASTASQGAPFVADLDKDGEPDASDGDVDGDGVSVDEDGDDFDAKVGAMKACTPEQSFAAEEKSDETLDSYEYAAQKFKCVIDDEADFDGDGTEDIYDLRPRDKKFATEQDYFKVSNVRCTVTIIGTLEVRANVTNTGPKTLEWDGGSFTVETADAELGGGDWDSERIKAGRTKEVLTVPLDMINDVDSGDRCTAKVDTSDE